MNITLIGMPASGKSCMARYLSKKLKMKTVDGDRLIEQVTGRELQEIIDNDGLDEFKRIEEEVLLTIKDEDMIVSPGGSAIYYPSVMENFKKHGIVVYLYASVEVIIDRLGDFSKRGVALRPGQTIYDLYDERTPLLEKYADIVVNCDGAAFGKYQVEALMKIQEYLLK
jgi:shikimate kinase